MDISELQPVSIEGLKEIMEVRERIERLIYKDVHEDIVGYMLAPIESVLSQSGVNLSEQNI